MHAEMLMARDSCYVGDGDYLVTPTSNKKETPGGILLVLQLVVEVHDQLISLHRHHHRIPVVFSLNFFDMCAHFLSHFW